MNKGLKEIIKAIFSILGLLAMFLIGYTYKGPLPTEDSSTIGLGGGLIILIILWPFYKMDSLKNKIMDLEAELRQYTDKEKDTVYIPPLDIQKMLARGEDIKKAIIERNKKIKFRIISKSVDKGIVVDSLFLTQTYGGYLALSKNVYERENTKIVNGVKRTV